MARLALGLIETIGLPAAVAAADTAVKSAHVALVGYELTRGGGLVAVKVVGDVGAVRAAVDAGAAEAERVGRLWSKHVIARPHEELEKLLRTKENVGTDPEGRPAEPGDTTGTGEGGEELPPGDQTGGEEQPPEEYLDRAMIEPAHWVEEPGAPVEEPPPVPTPEEPRWEPPPSPAETEEPEAADGEGPEAPEDEEEEGDDDLCNLCHDPACPRRKGEPRVKCIHWDGD